jgi:hypothetical protein
MPTSHKLAKAANNIFGKAGDRMPDHGPQAIAIYPRSPAGGFLMGLAVYFDHFSRGTGA